MWIRKGLCKSAGTAQCMCKAGAHARAQRAHTVCGFSVETRGAVRCEGTHFGVKFSKAPLRGGRRYAPCTPAQDRAACGEKMGSNPHFGAILGFFSAHVFGACFRALGKRRMFSGPRKKAHVSTHSTLVRGSTTPFNTGRCPRLHLCCGVSLSRHTDRREKHQTGNSWILAIGVVE